MKTVSNKEYLEIKYDFLKSHNDWHVETSKMDTYGKYVKTYMCSNGDTITEINRPVYETVHVTVKGVEMDIQVQLFASEMFSNKFESIFTYEKY